MSPFTAVIIHIRKPSPTVLEVIRMGEQLRRERINETSRESVHANNVPDSNHG